MGDKLNPTKCIKLVSRRNGWHLGQCDRKRGHGPGGLFCKQHDPERVASRRKVKDDAYEAEFERKRVAYERYRVLNKLAEGISTRELKNFRLMYKPELVTLLDSSAFIMRAFGKLIFDNWPVSVPGKDEALGKVAEHRISLQEVLKEL